MPRFGSTRRLVSTKGAADCLRSAREVVTAVGCRLDPDPGELQITGRFGKGWALRLVGALLAPPRWFPLSVSIVVRDDGSQREITLRVDENFGIGSLFGAEERMRARCEEIADQVGSLLRDRLI